MLEFATDTFRFQTFNLPPSQFWLTDFTPNPGDMALPIVFPAWVPRQVYIVRAMTGGYWPALGPNPQGDLDLSIDHGGIAYATGLPPQHQTGGDERRDEQLVRTWAVKPADDKNFWPPKLLNRDALDKLWFEVDCPNGFPYAWFEIDFLIPAPTQPGIIPPPPTDPWTMRAQVTFDGWSFGWDNWTIAVAVDASVLSNLSGGSQTRVVFNAPGGISRAFIGPRVAGTLHQAASLTPLTKISDGSWTCSQGIDGTNGVVVTAHITAGYIGSKATLPGWHSYYLAGDDAGTANGVGYTLGGNAALAVQSIQAAYP